MSDVFKIPYDEFTLKLALMQISDKLDDPDLQKKLGQELDKLAPGNKSDINKKVAEENGISVKDLIDSPNYEKLKNEYVASMLHKAVDVFIKEGFTEKQAWAVLSIGLGVLKI